MRLLAYCRRRCWPLNAFNQAACRVEHERRARATFALCLARFAGNVFNAVRCLITGVWRPATPTAISKQTHKQTARPKKHALSSYLQRAAQAARFLFGVQCEASQAPALFRAQIAPEMWPTLSDAAANDTRLQRLERFHPSLKVFFGAQHFFAQRDYFVRILGLERSLALDHILAIFAYNSRRRHIGEYANFFCSLNVPITLNFCRSYSAIVCSRF